MKMRQIKNFVILIVVSNIVILITLVYTISQGNENLRQKTKELQIIQNQVDSLRREIIASDYAFYKTVVNPIEHATCKVIIADLYETYKSTHYSWLVTDQSFEVDSLKQQLTKLKYQISKETVDPEEKILTKEKFIRTIMR